MSFNNGKGQCSGGQKRKWLKRRRRSYNRRREEGTTLPIEGKLGESLTPSVKAIIGQHDEGLKRIIVWGYKKTKCPSCKRTGSLIPQDRSNSTRVTRFKCGKNQGTEGCKHTCTQVEGLGQALGISDVSKWRMKLPTNLLRRINLLKVKVEDISLHSKEASAMKIVIPSQNVIEEDPIQGKGKAPQILTDMEMAEYEFLTNIKDEKLEETFRKMMEVLRTH